MKILKYLFPVVLFFIFTSCSENKHAIQVGPKGVVQDSIFIDDRYHLEIAIPAGWEVDDTSKYDKRTILRLNHDEHNSFVFASEPLLPAQHFEDYLDVKYQLIKSRSKLANMFGTRSTITDLGRYTEEINGIEFNLIEHRYRKDNVKGILMSGQYYLQTERDLITFSKIGDIEITKELNPSINAVNFASLPPADDSQVTIDRDYYKKGRKSTDNEGFFNLHDYGAKMPVPKAYTIKRNVYADGWATRIEKDSDNHIAITERLIDEGLSFDEYISETIKKLNTSNDGINIKLKSKKIHGEEYSYFKINIAEIVKHNMESAKEKYIKENSKEEYDKNYKETMKTQKGKGVYVFMRKLNNKEFLNVELTYNSKESQDELMEIIDEAKSLKHQ